MSQKTCTICGQTKPERSFKLSSPGHRRNQCATCRNATWWASYKARHPKPPKPIDREELARRLAGHEMEPTVAEPVRRFVRGLDCAFTLRDVANALGLPRHITQRVLVRMVQKGQLTREAVPMPKRCGRYMAMVPTYLYTPINPESWA